MDDNMQYYASNVAMAEKIGTTFSLMDLFDDTEETVVLSKDGFFKMLDRWEQVCNMKYKEIIVTRDGDDVFFEGKY